MRIDKAVETGKIKPGDMIKIDGDNYIFLEATDGRIERYYIVVRYVGESAMLPETEIEVINGN